MGGTSGREPSVPLLSLRAVPQEFILAKALEVSQT